MGKGESVQCIVNGHEKLVQKKCKKYRHDSVARKTIGTFVKESWSAWKKGRGSEK